MEKTNIWGDGFVNNADEIGHYNVFGRNVRINPLHDGQKYAKIGNFCHLQTMLKLAGALASETTLQLVKMS